jgi:hypothetical protein
MRPQAALAAAQLAYLSQLLLLLLSHRHQQQQRGAAQVTQVL